jgi:tRNA(fMet)-specific endonuclease VapC
MKVLDTNTVVHALKGIGSVRSKFLSSPKTEISISATTALELEYGTLRLSQLSPRRTTLALLLNVGRVIPFTSTEATIAAELRLALERQGRMIGPYDLLIAATALAANATLVTNNISEFSRVENLTL